MRPLRPESFRLSTFIATHCRDAVAPFEHATVRGTVSALQTRRCVVVVSIFEVPGEGTRWLAAGAVLARAAFSLFVHGLVSFGQPGALSRATGIVSRR